MKTYRLFKFQFSVVISTGVINVRVLPLFSKTQKPTVWLRCEQLVLSSTMSYVRILIIKIKRGLGIVHLLWFNFILGLNFISLCFKLIITYYHTPKQREIKFKPRIKLSHNTSTELSDVQS